MGDYTFLEKILFPHVRLNTNKLRKSLDGKTVLITGASSGIGEILAYRLADFNVHMIIVARTEEKLLDIKREIEMKTARVSAYQADLRNDADVQGLLAFIHKLPGGLDMVVSNAGKSIRRPIFDSLDRYHDFTRTMAINYFAPVQLLLSLIPLLKKNRGQIINISTINVLMTPFPFWAAYQASKSAFDTWLRSATPELNAAGISTMTLYLPLVRTPMILPTPEYQKMPAMSPGHVADIICRSMYAKRKKYKPWWLIFGQLASVILWPVWDISISRILKKRRSNKNV